MGSWSWRSFTALELHRNGVSSTSIRILERGAHTSTHGDSFTISHSALQILKHYPKLSKLNDEIAYYPLLKYCDIEGNVLAGPLELTFAMNADTRELLETKYSRGLTGFWRHSRPRFAQLLVDALKEIGVRVEYGKEVVEYFERDAKAAVVLRDGLKLVADLVIAADGLRSSSWFLISDKPTPARSSGRAIYRAAWPVELAISDPIIAERFPLLDDGRSCMELWVGPNLQASFWRNQHHFMMTINHADDDSAGESWSNNVTAEHVLQSMATIPNRSCIIDRIIKTIPANSIIDWKLMWRDPQPKWTSPGGRVLQLGDAAHTFLPSSGNGATQAIEDAVSLAACLSVAGNISEATQVHNLLRFQRVSCLQAFGVVNSGKHRSAYESRRDKQMSPKNQVHVSRWMIDHGPEQYALQNFDKASDHLKNGTAFVNTNIPPGMLYRPWNIETILEQHAKGDATVLDGDWSWISCCIK
ncbi:hypothetical protein MRB53_038572 [Persea americana]|nr:hypothetical protein MRB53_038572 [Persea americana]